MEFPVRVDSDHPSCEVARRSGAVKESDEIRTASGTAARSALMAHAGRPGPP